MDPLIKSRIRRLHLPTRLPEQGDRRARIIARQFSHVLATAGIKQDAFTGANHSIYSLRHIGICMRIILHAGQANIFNPSKNAGTSVEQIERFYARNLPLSAAMTENLHSFGKETG